MQAATITVKRERGVLVVQALGRTPKGKTYIKGAKKLKATKIGSKDFKAEMTAAVDELLGSEE